MQAVDNLGSVCIVEIFPYGQTQRDCLFVKGQRLLSGVVVHLVCGCTVNQNMHGIVTVSATRDFLYILTLTCCCFGELVSRWACASRI